MQRISLALPFLATMTLSGCFSLGGGEFLPDQTLQPPEVTEFLGAVPPSAFVFHDFNEQGFPEYSFEIDGSLMVGLPSSGGFPPMLVDKYEITNAQYRRFCDASRRVLPKNATNPAWRHYYFLPKPGHPIDHVDWYDASDYARWSGKVLPTAAEWSRAVSFGGTPPWTEGPTDLFVANIGEVRRRAPDRVGSYPADVSPAGVYDMAGNIDEWVDDAGHGASRRVMGGYWDSPRDELIALTTIGITEEATRAFHGFRTIFRLEPVRPPPPAAGSPPE